MTTNRPVQLLDIEQIKPYENNAKKHSAEQVGSLVKLIERFGWTQPIVTDRDFVIIAGHGRRLAALEMGLKKVPVIVREDLTKDEANALRLADNRVSSTEYDLALEQAELQALSMVDLNFDLTDLGYSEHELNFSTADLGELDDSIFVDDINGAVEKQKNENKEKVEEVDDVAAPVVDALGFKRVTIAESRVLRDLMARMEVATGKKGAPALIDFVSSRLEKAA
jgi:hypothetical protein